MDRLNTLLRYPASLLDLVETGIVLLVAFGLPINSEQQTWIVATVVALIGLAKGLSTRPFPVHVIPDLGRALFILAASFGLHLLSPDRIDVLVTFLGTFTTLVATLLSSPRHEPTLGAQPTLDPGHPAAYVFPTETPTDVQADIAASVQAADPAPAASAPVAVAAAAGPEVPVPPPATSPAPSRSEAGHADVVLGLVIFVAVLIALIVAQLLSGHIH